jgi:hypothetical protein
LFSDLGFGAVRGQTAIWRQPCAERPQASEDGRRAPAGLDGLPRQACGGQVEGVRLAPNELVLINCAPACK